MIVSHISSASSNLEEYIDPERYDMETHQFEPDGSFLLALAQQLGGPVLELGCGTGRLAIPLAQHGIDMTGLDIVPGMLARAKQKAGDLPIAWVEADARAFQLGRKVRLIFDNGAAFMHVLARTDHEAILACVREHLDTDGRYVLCVSMLQPTQMTDKEEREWFSYVDHQGCEVRVSGTERYDLVRQIYHEDAVRRWRDEAGQEVIRHAPLARRIFFPPELEALLHYNGFTVLDRYGSWDASPLTNESHTMIFVCKRTL
jgi:SAM-dependent methyltransferase